MLTVTDTNRRLLAEMRSESPTRREPPVEEGGAPITSRGGGGGAPITSRGAHKLPSLSPGKCRSCVVLVLCRGSNPQVGFKWLCTLFSKVDFSYRSNSISLFSKQSNSGEHYTNK